MKLLDRISSSCYAPSIYYLGESPARGRKMETSLREGGEVTAEFDVSEGNYLCLKDGQDDIFIEWSNVPTALREDAIKVMEGIEMAMRATDMLLEPMRAADRAVRGQRTQGARPGGHLRLVVSS